MGRRRRIGIGDHHSRQCGAPRDRQKQRLIRTVPRTGFRFIGAIKKEAGRVDKGGRRRVSPRRHGIFAAFVATLPMTEKPEPQAEDAQS
jgi:DNA-binding winged helix-turn-helix (wHTH) protein